MITKITDGFVSETLPDGAECTYRIENTSTQKLVTEKNRLQAILHPTHDVGWLSHEEAKDIHDLLEPINTELSIRKSANIS